MSIQTPVKKALIVIMIVLGLARLLMLGLYPLMDTTEARYGEIARKMVELNDWVTPWYDYDESIAQKMAGLNYWVASWQTSGVPFWAKPPLSIWATAISIKTFGVNEFAARFPHWLGGVLVGWLVWSWAKKRSQQEAIYAIALLMGSLLFFTASGAVMTDMYLLIGTTLAMRGFWLGLYGNDQDSAREKWIFFLGVGVGLLAKGPLTFVLVGLPIVAWVLITGNLKFAWKKLPWVWGTLLALAIASPWYVLAELKTPGFLNYFLVGEHWHRFVTAGWKGDLYGTAHSFPRGTIWVFAFADLLPWTILLPIAAFYWRKQRSLVERVDKNEKNWRIYLLAWALAPAIFFTTAGNILWPYVLPGFPGLALWTAAWLVRQSKQRAVENILISGLIFTLIGTLLFLANLSFSGRSELKSAKALVVDYQHLRQNNEPLVFVGNRPYSASFYSEGKAERVQNYAQLLPQIEHQPAFVAIEKNSIKSLTPEDLKHFVLVKQYGKFTLFTAQ